MYSTCRALFIFPYVFVPFLLNFDPSQGSLKTDVFVALVVVDSETSRILSLCCRMTFKLWTVEEASESRELGVGSWFVSVEEAAIAWMRQKSIFFGPPAVLAAQKVRLRLIDSNVFWGIWTTHELQKEAIYDWMCVVQYYTCH